MLFVFDSKYLTLRFLLITGKLIRLLAFIRMLVFAAPYAQIPVPKPQHDSFCKLDPAVFSSQQQEKVRTQFMVELSLSSCDVILVLFSQPTKLCSFIKHCLSTAHNAFYVHLFFFLFDFMFILNITFLAPSRAFYSPGLQDNNNLRMNGATVLSAPTC